jgi:hypothetical protein
VRLLARHLRANAVAYLAIFVALGGTSYAAITIPNNSVGNKQLKKDAVDSKKVKNSSLTPDDVKAGQAATGPPGIEGALGAQGAVGNKGPQGDQGDKGQRGDQGVPGISLTPSKSVSEDPVDIDVLAADTVLLTAPAVVTTTPTRLRAAALGTFLGDSSTAADCAVKVATDGGAKTVMGQRSMVQVPSFSGLTTPVGAEGAVNVAAGSHVVTFECLDGSSTAGTGFTFQRGDLRVTTSAQ